MKKLQRTLLCVALGLAAALVLACCDEAPAEDEVRISWDRSTFQVMADAPVDDPDVTGNLYYPRIKRVADGGLLFSWMDDHFGWNIFTRRSEDDGRTWGPVTVVRKRFPAVSSVGDDEVVLVNPDFLQLSDGRIMLAWQWRYLKGYNDLAHTNENCGIEIAFSSDGGRTWGEPREVYRGRCWEPAMLELPSGEIHLYLTDSQNVVDGMSCPKTSLIRSFDGGATWQGKPCCTWKDVEGISYTKDDRFGYDGMATAVLLDDGSIAMSVEVWSGKYVVDQTPVVVRSSNNWTVDQEALLAEGGPAYPDKKQLNKDMVGYGPYMTRLPSGEVLVLTNGQYRGVQGMWLFTGTRQADRFTHATSPFDGYWGSVADIGGGKVLVTGTQKYREDGADHGRVPFIVGRLNRALSLDKGLSGLVPLEAFDRDNGRSWFLGGQSPQTCAYYDFGYDREAFAVDVHLFSDRLDGFTPENSDAAVVLIGRGTDTYKVVVPVSGPWLLYRQEAESWHRIGAGDPVREVSGTVNDDADIDTGFAARAAVPWSLLGGKPHRGETLRIHPARWIKTAAREKAPRLYEELEGEDPDFPQTWLPVRL